VRLSWTDEPEDADFAAYVILWDEGAGGMPETLLARVADPAARGHETGPLDPGDYQFALAYEDVAGNVSSAGTPVEATIDEAPLPVEGLALDYSETTRAATLTWTDPAGQVA